MVNEKASFLRNIFGFVTSNTNTARMKEELQQKQDEITVRNKLLEDIGSQLTTPSLIASESPRLDDIMGDMTKRVNLKFLKAVYLRNQFIFRGINIRASELVSRGYDIVGEDGVGVKKCSDLIKNSGGSSFLRQSSVNADVFGKCFWEQIPSIGGEDILLLKQVHPMTFGFKTDLTTNIIIMGTDKTPLCYMQRQVNPETGEEKYVDVPKDKITHIKYNTFGDEFDGISTLQPVYDTILRLMNMENSAAIAALKTANPTIVLKTDAKNPVVLAKWGKSIGKISSQEQVLLGDNQELKFLSPGNQNFNDYAEYFLAAVVSATAVPRSILLGGDITSSGNRAETITLSKHFYTVIRDNQLIFETEINKIFEKYAEMGGFKAPRFVFVDVAEDAEYLAKMAIELFGAGIISQDEARTMVGLGGTPGVKIVGKNINPASEIKKTDNQTYHPASPGSPEGSQKGEKKSMEKSPDSSFKGEGFTPSK